MGRRFAAQMGAPLTAQSIEITALEIRHDRQNRDIARRCHVAMRKARAGYALRIFKPPRRPRATWSSPRRVARGEIELM